MKTFAAFFFIVFGLGQALTAQSLSAAFDTTHVEVGDPVMLQLWLTDSPQPPETIDLSAWSEYFPPENILDQTGWVKEKGVWHNTITLICFMADTMDLDPVALLAGGAVVRSAPLYLEVSNSPAPENVQDMADIKDIHREDAKWTDYLFWILLVGGLIFLAALAYFISRFIKNRQKPLVSRVIQAPAHQTAFRKLELLSKNRALPQAEYYGSLSYILREYLEGRFNFPALQWDKEAILKKLREQEFPNKFEEPLEEFITRTDLAKFARAELPMAYRKEAFDLVYEVVEETKPQEDTLEENS